MTDTPGQVAAGSVKLTSAPASAPLPAPAPIPTGFPEPASAPEPPAPRTPGKVTLSAVPPMGTLTIPGAGDKGEDVVITRYGTEVDEATAQRAREAAAASGFAIREG